jgi:hypothetical protein
VVEYIAIEIAFIIAILVPGGVRVGKVSFAFTLCYTLGSAIADAFAIMTGSSSEICGVTCHIEFKWVTHNTHLNGREYKNLFEDGVGP